MHRSRNMFAVIKKISCERCIVRTDSEQCLCGSNTHLPREEGDVDGVERDVE
jgi:hypothetical protein